MKKVKIMDSDKTYLSGFNSVQNKKTFINKNGT